ncbi:uncharacterized protein LOC120169686 [Hibiscus syriacus]|uniref:uncharacterized protein LOC120169686 n=1 Tax=Hibiscus syriacus TaxID=106335 RepID=UPI001923D599|nr:uncharacterized protein LOC120169686 [Hibiscus syriacus]
MNKSRRCFTSLFILLLSHRIVPVIGQSEQQKTATNEDKPSPFQFVLNTMSLLKKAHKNSVERIKTTVHDFRLQFTSPKPGEETAMKNVESKKGSVEETTKPAAETEPRTAQPAAETEQKTAEKVEEASSDKKESRDEL